MDMPTRSKRSFRQLQTRVAELEQSLDRLQKSEFRYRQCFKNAPVSLLFVSAEGDPIEMNPAAEKFLGWTIAKAKASGFNGFTHPALLENGTVDSFQRAIAGETVIEPPMSFDPSSTIGQGQWKWAQGHYYPIRDELGQVREAIEMALDLTPMYEVQQGLTSERDTAIQQQLADLTTQNEALNNRDRLLEANAAAAQALLTTENLDEAIAAALKIIGQCLDTDRVTLIENFESPADPYLCWQVLYEWTSPGTISQLSHPDLASGNYEGMDEIYALMESGRGVSILVEEMPEPFRSGQARLGVKALYIIPVFVEGRLWGGIGFDDCHHVRQRSAAELTILKTAASCIGSLVRRDRVIRSHIAELETQNRLLESRDRLLDATAMAVNALLTINDFERSINTALQILGEGLQTDRVGVIKNFTHPADPSFPYWQVLYEWNSPGTIAQFSDSNAAQGSYEEIQAFYDTFQQGQIVSYFIEDAPEPFRSRQMAIGVKSTQIVPIFVEGQWWGVLGLDDCREAKQRSAAEISLLKIAATCVGSAIDRQARTKELSKINAVLRRSVNHLTTTASLQSFPIAVLKEAIAASGAVTAGSFVYSPSTHTLQMVDLILHGEVIEIATDPRAEMWRLPIPADITNAWQMVTEAQIFFSDIDNPHPEFWPFSIPWHRQFGHKETATIPLSIGENLLGILGLCFTTAQAQTKSELELFYTLGQQAAIALRLTQLSEQAQQATLLAERNRMARELHDTLAQTFTGVIMQLEAAQAMLAATPAPMQKHLAHAGLLARQGLNEARRSVWSLRPEALETDDLQTALLRLVQQMTDHTTISTEVLVDGTPIALPEEVETHLLRIGQEALTNILKHSQARHIQLTVQFRSDSIALHIVDNGRGFDIDLPRQGFGITSMQQRTQQIGGAFALASQIGQGTTIEVKIPVSQLLSKAK
jgi:PAS domain S-box-containing protein